MKSAAILVAAVLCARAADFPMTLVSEDEAEPMHSAIMRKEAWTQDAVRHLRAEAEKRLKEGPWTVTSDRPAALALNPHEYYSEAPFWWPDPDNPNGPYIRREGQANPSRFVANRNALMAMADAVFTLGTAAFLLDEPRYAQRAVRVINTWFINPKTRMEPGMEYAQSVPGPGGTGGNGVVEGRAFVRAIQGMEFLAQTDAWDPKERMLVRKWFAEYLKWLVQSRANLEDREGWNNRSTWWAAQVAGVASFIEDTASRDLAFAAYRNRGPRQFRAPAGTAPDEPRTRLLAYSALNLEACATLCRIAQVQGVDLWNVSGRSGATVASMVENLAPYFQDRRKWPHERAGDFPADSLYTVALAGIGLKRPDYVDLFRKVERPDSAWLSFVDLLVGRWENAAHQTRH